MIKLLIILSLMLIIPLSANAQIVNDGTDHVDVYDYPFDITVLEGGSFTLHNENRTGNINIVSHGWFDRHIALENSTVTVQLTDAMFPDTYYVSDIMDNSFYSTIIVKDIPQVNFNATSSETVGTYTPFVEEPVIQERVVLENTIVEYSQPTTVQVPTVEIITDKEVLNIRLQILQVLESIFKIVLG
tara:strand:- start:32 stop:592 length:561 start_codon:yes stop_codon:yes gene_type:complete